MQVLGELNVTFLYENVFHSKLTGIYTYHDYDVSVLYYIWYLRISVDPVDPIIHYSDCLDISSL